MKSILNRYLGENVFRVPRGLLITTSVTILSIHSIFGQGYDELNIVPLDDFFDVRTPSVDQYVDIGGFELKVDRTKWGLDLTRNNHGFLGRLEGRDVDIDVLEIPRSRSGNQIAERAALATDSSRHLQRVYTSHAVRGVKDVYRGKPFAFSQNIRAIRYFFVNSQGETICFAAHAKSAYPDWSDAIYLVQNTLSLAKEPRS